MAERDLVFFSYRHDKQGQRWIDLILRWLSPYALGHRLVPWSDRDIRTGEFWDTRIVEAIDRSRVAVLLVNQTFFGSDYIVGRELPRLVQAARAGDLTLVCVPVGPSDKALRERHGLDPVQFTHSPQSPLSDTTGGQRERSLTEVAMKIHAASGPALLRPTAPAPVAGRSIAALAARRSVPAAMFDVPTLDERHIVARVDVLDLLRTRLLSSQATAHGLTAAPAGLGVHGMGGMGKTVVAQMLAHDDKVRRAFSDGIAWIALGQQPDLLALQNRLLRQFAPGTLPAATPAEARAVLREVLHDRRVLLVIDDVWDARHVEAFDVVGAKGRQLLTTRDAAVLAHAQAMPLELGRLPATAARELLAKWAGVGLAALPAAADDVADQCAGLPLALALAGAQIAEGVGWPTLAQQLREGRLRFLDHPYGSVYESIGRSVDALEPAQRARYLELAAFPEDVAVPVPTVQRLWALSGLDAAQSERLLGRLARKALLVLQGEGSAAAVSLHDLQHDFLRARCDDLPLLHARLLQAHRHAYGLPQGPAGWARLPPDDPYLWPRLAMHLAAAGMQEELQAALLDINVLQARLQSVTTDHAAGPRADVAALRADFEWVDDASPARIVGQALRMSSPVLRERPGELALQLFGRLGAAQQADLRAVAAAGQRAGSGAALLPLRSTLQPPGALELMLTSDRGSVEGLLLLHDGRRVLTWSSDKVLRLWDLERGEALQTFEGHEGAIGGARILADGRRMLSWSGDGSLRLWSLDTGVCVHVFAGTKGEVRHASDAGMQLLPAEQLALAWCGPDTLRLWDLETPGVRSLFSSSASDIQGVLVVRQGHHALSWSTDGSLQLWDLDDPAALPMLLQGHEASVSGVLLLPDGCRALSWSSDSTLRLWDLQRGTAQWVLSGHRSAVYGVCLLSPGQRALSWSQDGTLRLWDLNRGELLATLQREGTGPILGVLPLPGETWALAWSVGGTNRLWDLERAQLVWERTNLSGIRGARLLPGGSQVLMWGEDDDRLRLIDAANGKLLRPLGAHDGRIEGALPLPDGERALSWSLDGTLRLWNLGEVVEVAKATGHEDTVLGALLLPEGQRALSWSVDGMLRTWDLVRAEPSGVLTGHEGLVAGALLLPDRQRVLSWSHDHTLRLWDIEGARPSQLLSGHTSRVVGVLLRADGRALSWSHDGTLRLWDLEQGRALTTMAMPADAHGVRGAVLLGDGRQALSWSRDGAMCIWDLEKGVPMRTLQEEFVRLAGVWASPDGTQALVLSGYGSAALWDLRPDGQRLELPGLLAAGARALADTRVWVRCNDGRLALWDFVECAITREVQAHAKRVAGVQPLSGGGRVLSWAGYGELRLWDMDRGTMLRDFVGHRGRVIGVLPLPDEQHMLSWAADRTLRLWDLGSGSQLGLYSFDAGVGTVLVSSDAQRVLIGDDRGGVQIAALQLPRAH